MDIQTESIVRALRGASEEKYGNNYREHYLAQYLKYIETADKISERRASANAFFLTLHSGLISGMGIAAALTQRNLSLLCIVICVIAGTLCAFWYWMIIAYRDLNSAKFKVIHALESQLPARPYDAEWEALARGVNDKVYFPFTHIERIIPIIFISLYALLVIILLIMKPVSTT